MVLFTLFNFDLLSIYQGGLKAVLWTDAFQLTVMAVGVLLVIIFGTNAQQDGLTGIWNAAKLSGRLDFIE